MAVPACPVLALTDGGLDIRIDHALSLFATSHSDPIEESSK
jgi:hypothetical protein